MKVDLSIESVNQCLFTPCLLSLLNFLLFHISAYFFYEKLHLQDCDIVTKDLYQKLIDNLRISHNASGANIRVLVT